MPEVHISALRKRFGTTSVLDGVDVHIADGEFFTLLGPSGCGKSTTLNCLAGLEEPTGGRITVGDEVFVDVERGVLVPPEERNLGMVFQSYALWPHKTIADNLALPLRIRRTPGREIAERTHEALDTVGLAHLADRYPHQLSGGQQQRVALARALVYSPRVLLLDEPLSNLDAKLREQAREWLKRLQADLGITTVYVTHDQEEALALSDRVAVLDAGELVQVGSPAEIYERPVDARVADFVGRCNFLPGTLAGVDGDRLTVILETGEQVVAARPGDGPVPAAGDPVSVALRPERLRLHPEADGVDGAAPGGADNAIAATVRTNSYVGSRHDVGAAVGATTVLAVAERPVTPGEARLVFRAEDARVFPRTVAGRDLVAEHRDEVLVAS